MEASKANPVESDFFPKWYISYNILKKPGRKIFDRFANRPFNDSPAYS